MQLQLERRLRVTVRIVNARRSFGRMDLEIETDTGETERSVGAAARRTAEQVGAGGATARAAPDDRRVVKADQGAVTSPREGKPAGGGRWVIDPLGELVSCEAMGARNGHLCIGGRRPELVRLTERNTFASPQVS